MCTGARVLPSLLESCGVGGAPVEMVNLLVVHLREIFVTTSIRPLELLGGRVRGIYTP